MQLLFLSYMALLKGKPAVGWF